MQTNLRKLICYENVNVYYSVVGRVKHFVAGGWGWEVASWHFYHSSWQLPALAEAQAWLGASGYMCNTYTCVNYLCATSLSRYGRFTSEVSYFICNDKETIERLFNGLRAGRKVLHTTAL